MNKKVDFQEIFGQNPQLKIKAPGRINLIGEHIDYNDGYVLPAAINRYIHFEIAPNELGLFRFFSVDFNEKKEFKVTKDLYRQNSWADYLLGVIEQLKLNGHAIGGFDLLFWGDIPKGAGLSSSAALECGLAAGLNQLFNLNIPKIELTKICQAAENEFVGVKCGIMDQFASTMGQKDAVILLDCDSLDYEYFPFAQNEYKIVLCDSGVKHSLGDSEYNTRRAECQKGFYILKAHYPHLQSWKQVTQADIEAVKHCYTGKVYERCSYVVAEIDRIKKGTQLLQNNDLIAFGQLMNQTHWGLSQQYEVSCPELDFLAHTAQNQPSVIGSRMMGGGFGGCTINLVHHTLSQQFISDIQAAYQQQYKLSLACHQVQIVDGVLAENIV